MNNSAISKASLTPVELDVNKLPHGFAELNPGELQSCWLVKNEAGVIIGWIGKAIFKKDKPGTGMYAYAGGPWIPAVERDKVEWLACTPSGSLWFSFENTKREILAAVESGKVAA